MRTIFVRIGVVFCALGFWIAAALLPAGAIVPAAILSIVFFESILPKRFPALWVLALAFFGEIFSPYPPLAFAAALLCAALTGAFVIRAYVSNRAIPGAALSALAAAAVFEILILPFANLARSGGGWIPVWNLEYAGFAAIRVLGCALVLAFALFVARQISPRIRGVVLSGRW